MFENRKMGVVASVTAKLRNGKRGMFASETEEYNTTITKVLIIQEIINNYNYLIANEASDGALDGRGQAPDGLFA